MQEIYRALHWLAHKLTEMDKELKAVKELLLRQKPASIGTNVEKIEYNFEQLKVDTLDGTLIIGITPRDGGKLEAWDVAGEHGEDTGFPLTEDDGELLREMDHYIRTEIPPLLREEAARQNIVLLPHDEARIREDMARQVRARVPIYARFLAKGACIERLRADLRQAVEKYVSSCGKERNGENE